MISVELGINNLAMFEETRSSILVRTYRTKSVRTVDIPKNNEIKCILLSYTIKGYFNYDRDAKESL